MDQKKGYKNLTSEHDIHESSRNETMTWASHRMQEDDKTTTKADKIARKVKSILTDTQHMRTHSKYCNKLLD